MSKRIALFGGSFDPVHYGHLIMAEQCREQAKLDAIVFVPANQSPLKPQAPMATARQRLEMLALATSGHPSFRVDTFEVDRAGSSFTIDTLREFRLRSADDQLYFIVGSDALKDFARWREPSEILKLATPLVVGRPGQAASLEILKPLISSHRWDEIMCGRVESPLVDISSSDIRRRVGSGRSIRFMLPRAVEVYIESHGIYGTIDA